MKSEWFETFFRGVAVEFWTRLIPSAVTVQEADFLDRTLAPPDGGRLLDVACGNGRHAIELARRGYRVTGVDLSDDFLAAARESSTGLRGVEWVKGDMRSLDAGSGFDGAWCWGNSFGYLDYTNAQALLGSLARALKPGAKLAIDTGVAAESILPAMPTRRWHRAGDMVMLSEARYFAEASRLDIEYTFLKEGVSESHSTSSYVMTVAELGRSLRQSGFEIAGLYSGLTGEPYQLGSPRLIVVGQASSRRET